MRRSVQIVAAMLSVLLFAAFGYGFYNYRNLTTHQQQIHPRGLGPPTAADGASGATSEPDTGSAENILLVGLDSRAGLSTAQEKHLKVGLDDGETTSTDTIIVVHVPANGKKATLLSIPRDTYVDIPGFSPDKINAAYIDGYNSHPSASQEQDESNGATKLIRVVKNLTGLEIDHYVQVGFGGFVNIVKAIKTVPVDLCESVDDTYAHNRAEGGSGGSGFKMSAGEHDLTPTQALEFVRQRHNLPGPVTDDIGREARQRYFLKQAFGEIATAGVLLNPIKLKDLISAVDGAFTFGGSNFGILQFAEQMSQLSSGHITGASIPNTGYPLIDNQYVVTVNVPAVRRFAHRAFYGSGTQPRHRSGAPKKKTANTDPARSGCIY